MHVLTEEKCPRRSWDTLHGEKILSEHLKLAEKDRMSGEKLVKGVIFLFKGPDCPCLLACL